MAGVTMTLFKSSQMPRHLIGDAYEWINEILSVLTHILVKLQRKERFTYK